jgi:pilus assembly protein CpaC
MHRTKRRSRFAAWGVFLGLVLGGTAGGGAWGQEPMPMAPPRPGAAGAAGAIIVPINGTQILRMSTNKAIAKADNSRDTVAQVRPVEGDPRRVLVIGLEPGITQITLTDVDGAVEKFEVVVQFDVEYLSNLLKRAVPSANITPIPAANNTVILTGHVARAEDVDVVLRTAQSVVLGPDRVVNALRVGGVMQVQLCVTIAQVSRSEFRRMAFDWLASDGDWFWGSVTSGALTTPSQIGRGSGTFGPAGGLSGIPGAPNGAPTNIFLGVLRENSGFLAFLQALRDENVAKVLAEPRLVTLSGRPASFLSGGEQAVPVPAGLGQVGVQFEEFGTRLNFLPVVLGNGRIYLEVEPEVSTLDAANGTNIQGTVVPGRVTQRVHTSVELEDGQTFVIGGLIQRLSTGTARKVPVLGDLPFIGTAFRGIAYDERETELVVMVTPHLVDALACNQVPNVVPGMETRTPDDFELFLEGILEAPRGPRNVYEGHRYVPAYRSSPTAGQFPCAENGRHGGFGANGACGNGACGDGACGNGACGSSAGAWGGAEGAPVTAAPPLGMEATPLAEAVPLPLTKADNAAPGAGREVGTPWNPPLRSAPPLPGSPAFAPPGGGAGGAKFNR